VQYGFGTVPCPTRRQGGRRRTAASQACRRGCGACAQDPFCRRRSPTDRAWGAVLAPLALWASMVASVGLASRPALSRTSTYGAWWIRPSVPSQSSSPDSLRPCSGVADPWGRTVQSQSVERT
jgi:hypothetical protein